MGFSLDNLEEKEVELLNKVQAAVESGDTKALWAALGEKVEMEVKARKAMDEQGMIDAQILQSRGVRMLTSAENSYYNKLIKAMKSKDYRNAVSDPDVTMPETIIDEVMKNIRSNHPLLDAIDFVKVNGKFRYWMSTDIYQKAAWGALTEEITQEIDGGFKEIDLGQKKLTAFMPISRDMLDLGAVYLDAYIRGLLEEALANGLEDGIINGTGVDQPIGMTKSIEKKTEKGEAADKSSVEITEMTLENVGALCATLSTNSFGKVRPVQGLILVCNEADYWSKVMPATSHYTPEGGLIKDLVPGTDTKIIRSLAVATGVAVFGIAKNYFLGFGLDKGGRIEASDDFKFLEDKRYYKIKTYGNGQAKDENDFIKLNIANLKPWVMKVESSTTNGPVAVAKASK